MRRNFFMYYLIYFLFLFSGCNVINKQQSFWLDISSKSVMIILYILIVLTTVLIIIILRISIKKVTLHDQLVDIYDSFKSLKKIFWEKAKKHANQGGNFFIKWISVFNNYLFVLPHQQPLFIITGEERNNKNVEMLNHCNLKLNPQLKIEKGHKNCRFWFCEQGIILGFNGSNFLAEKNINHKDENFYISTQKKEWKLLLRLLRNYRFLNPGDGIIISISYQDLKNDHDKKKEKISEYIFSRLLEAQQKFLKKQLSVYILITQCDKMTGFLSLYKEANNKYSNLNNQIFGWTNCGTDIEGNLLDFAYEEMDIRINKIRNNLLSEGLTGTSGITDTKFKEMFNFLPAFNAFKTPLSKYLGKLVTDKRFLIEGIYFCGERPDCNDEQSKFIYINDLLNKRLFDGK